jgi:hypothetical protein
VVGNERERVVRGATQRLIIKIVTTLAIGGVAFVIASVVGSGVGNEVILNIGVSVFVSGVTFLTGFLIDVDRSVVVLSHEIGSLRSEYRDEAVATETLIKTELRSINVEFKKINDATELFGMVEASGLRPDAIIELVRNATTIKLTDSPLVFNFVQNEIGRLSDTLLRLGQRGDVTYDGEDRDWLLGLTRVSTRTIDATSLPTVDAGGRGYTEGGLWDSDLGRRYLEAQRAAIERGVRIRRIVVVDRQDLQDEAALMQVIDEHHRIGVDVRILDPRHKDVRRKPLSDFIVIDKELVYQSTATPQVDQSGNPLIEHTRLVTKPEQVRDRITRYEELWEISLAHPANGLSYAASPERSTSAGHISASPERSTSAGHISASPERSTSAGNIAASPERSTSAGRDRPQPPTNA